MMRRAPRPVVALVLVLLAAGVVGLLGARPADAATGFRDVGSTDPWVYAVRYLTSAQVISGYSDGTFRPYDPVNRGQLAKILVRQKEVPLTDGAGARFTDLDGAYGPYVLTAASRGWIAGYGDGTFRPYSPLQRQHAAAVLVRSLGWEPEAKALSSGEVVDTLLPFVDRGEISVEARPYVALAVKRGLFGGRGDRFLPQGTITRGQFALVAYRAELDGLAVIQGVRFSSDHPDRTRVVFDLSRAPGSVGRSTGPGGVALIDMAGAALSGANVGADIHSLEVARVGSRQSNYRPPVVRINVDLGRADRVETTVMQPSNGLGYRLVIDVFRREKPVDGIPLVCLDAGHGGRDSGAVGVTGVLEKDVNLAMTLALNDYLKAAGLRTILTRAGDTYPTLTERATIANDAQADLFVSIHNNAASDAAAQGTYTFYWGTPADYSVEGKALATAIQKQLVAELGSADRGATTHWNSLYVLANTNMTAALVEVGFLTNPIEEAKLKDPTYQRRAALAISRGIREYLQWTG